MHTKTQSVDVLAVMDAAWLAANPQRASARDDLAAARDAVAELADAGQNLREWVVAIVAWLDGEWVIQSEDDGHRLNGFAGTEHDARRELHSNREWAVARFDAALAAFKGEA